MRARRTLKVRRRMGRRTAPGLGTDRCQNTDWTRRLRSLGADEDAFSGGVGLELLHLLVRPGLVPAVLAAERLRDTSNGVGAVAQQVPGGQQPQPRAPQEDVADAV